MEKNRTLLFLEIPDPRDYLPEEDSQDNDDQEDYEYDNQYEDDVYNQFQQFPFNYD